MIVIDWITAAILFLSCFGAGIVVSEVGHIDFEEKED